MHKFLNFRFDYLGLYCLDMNTEKEVKNWYIHLFRN